MRHFSAAFTPAGGTTTLSTLWSAALQCRFDTRRRRHHIPSDQLNPPAPAPDQIAPFGRRQSGAQSAALPMGCLQAPTWPPYPLARLRRGTAPSRAPPNTLPRAACPEHSRRASEAGLSVGRPCAPGASPPLHCGATLLPGWGRPALSRTEGFPTCAGPPRVYPPPEGGSPSVREA